MLQNRTFDSVDCPRSTSTLFIITSMFRDALFEFNSFFMLLYVQLASPIAREVDYVTMYFVISMVLIFSRILGGLFWSFASHIMESHRFRYGNYRSMTFLGALLETLSFFCTFFLSPLFSSWGYVVSFLVFYTIGECVYAINDIGFWSFSNTISYDEKKRSKILSLANLLCAFGSYSVASISPAITSGNAKENLTILALILILLYFVSEMVYCFFMKERKVVNVSQAKKEKTGWFEPLRILKDRNILFMMLAMACFFLAQDIYIGNSSSYFYYEFGYGGFAAYDRNTGMNGGMVSFFYSLCYGVGIVISNYLYPLIQGKIGKKKTMISAFIGMSVFLSLMAIFGLKKGYEIPLFVFSFGLAFFSGFLYMSLTMNTYNAAEYYEYTYHKNRDASCVALKALGVKVANGLQTGIYYLFLALSGLLTLNQQVAVLEAKNARGEVADIVSSVNTLVAESNVSQGLLLFRLSLTLLPIVLLLIAVLLSVFGISFTDERKYQSMVTALQQRKKEENQEKQQEEKGEVA